MAQQQPVLQDVVTVVELPVHDSLFWWGLWCRDKNRPVGIQPKWKPVQVNAAMVQLDDATRRLLQLRYFHELSDRTICNRLGIRTWDYQQRISAARGALVAALQGRR